MTPNPDTASDGRDDDAARILDLVDTLTAAPDTATAMNATVTHEVYLSALRTAIAARIEDDATRIRVLNAKLLYGVGAKAGARAGTFFNVWANGGAHHAVIEVAAAGESSPLQLAGTMIHEIAHVVAGRAAGHGNAWKDAARLCGLRDAMQTGQDYALGSFDPALWSVLATLTIPGDGQPLFPALRNATPGAAFTATGRPCQLGVGARGGKSRGPGSGSRLVLWLCACPNPPRLRAARSAAVNAKCLTCDAPLRPQVR